jgi:hypothetical protein
LNGHWPDYSITSSARASGRVKSGRTRLDWELTSAQHPLVGERLLTEGTEEARRNLTLETAAVHRVNPCGIDLFDSIDGLPHWRFMGENPDLSVQRKHLRGQVLVHDRRLIAWLDEQIGREQTARRFLKDHASFIARRKNSN